MLPGTLSMESSDPARVSLSRERGDYAVTPLAIAMDEKRQPFELPVSAGRDGRRPTAERTQRPSAGQ